MSASQTSAAKAPQSPAPKPLDLSAIIAQHHNVMPANIEYALLAYVAAGNVNEKAILDILAAYKAGNAAGAQIMLDGLDGVIDGRFGQLVIDGADNAPRPGPATPEAKPE